MRYRTQIIVLVVSIFYSLTLIACNQTPASSVLQESTPVLPGSSIGELSDIVSAEGVVVPYREADLGFKYAGKVSSILVSEGELVSKDQELARLETRDLEQSELEAQAGLKSAQAQLDKIRAGARTEEIVAEKARLAITVAGVVAAERSVDIAEAGLESAKADLAATKDSIDVAEGSLAAAQATHRSAKASLDKVLKGATQIERLIAEKRVERVQNELFGLQKQRDATRNMLEGEIAASETAVEIAQLLLQDLEQGPSGEDIAVARAQVAEAQAGIQIAEAQLAQSQTQILQSEAGVNMAEAQLSQAEAEVEIAIAQRQQAQAQLDLVEAGSRSEDIAVAEAVVAQAEARLAAAKNALDDAMLKAPFAGTIGLIYIDEGELVSSLVPAIRMGDLSRLQIETEDLSEVDVNEVAVGQQVKITVDALDGRTFDGIVAQVAPTATDHRGDKVYAVLIDLAEGLESDLRWGMSTFVEIFMDQ